jgi:hypothetical protein
MHIARTPLLLAAALLTATPLAVLVDQEAPPPGRATLLQRRQAFAVPVALPECDGPAAPAALPVPATDERDEELARLRAALVALAAENAELREALKAQDEQWSARLDRSRLEDDLYQMLEQEFPALVLRHDPNSNDSVEEQVVDTLLDVADSLSPLIVTVDGEEEHVGTRRIGLAEVRAAVSDATIERLADRLVSWNREQALTPPPGSWSACGAGGGSSGAILYDMREVGGEIIQVERLEVPSDDPRVELAEEAAERVAAARARDLEALLGLPVGALD